MNKFSKVLSAAFLAVALVSVVACAPTAKQEGTGQYIVSVQPHHPHSNKIYGNTAFSGSNSSIRLLGQVGNFSKVPFSQT